MPSKQPQFNRRLPASTVQAIRDLAKRLGVSEADVIKLAVAEMASRYSPPASPKRSPIKNRNQPAR